MTIKVLIADDQALIRAGLVLILSSEPDLEIVGQAADGHEAVELARTEHPDVVLMDIQMPRQDGVAATKIITADGFRPTLVTVLMLTTFQTDDTVHAALRAGASGFVLKHAAPESLVAAIRAVAAGDAWLDPMVTRSLVREFAARPDGHHPTPAELLQLTERESAVLVELAHGFSNGEIAQRLVVGEATVKTHVSRILNKLGLRDRSQAVGVAYRSGLVQPGDAPPPAPGQIRQPPLAVPHRPPHSQERS